VLEHGRDGHGTILVAALPRSELGAKFFAFLQRLQEVHE
jgi:hypothetical protein